jgi:hypothetical protein
MSCTLQVAHGKRLMLISYDAYCNLLHASVRARGVSSYEHANREMVAVFDRACLCWTNLPMRALQKSACIPGDTRQDKVHSSAICV